MRPVRLSLECLEFRVVPSFLPPVHYSVGKSPSDIVYGDFNNDRNIDIVTANQEERSVSVLLGIGNGTFEPAKRYRTTGMPVALAAGDFNGDGNMDVATAHDVPNYFSSLTVLLGNGTGLLKKSHSISNITLDPYHVDAGDFNGDGRTDLLVKWTTGSFSVYLTDPDGQLVNHADYSGSPADQFCVTDFDADGILDVVSPGASDVVFKGNGDGTFTAKVGLVGGYWVTSADYDLDGHRDIMVTNGEFTYFYRGHSDFTFELFPFVIPYGGSYLATGDFNADGRPDLAYLSLANGEIKVIYNLDFGSFGNAENTGTTGQKLIAADLNADGWTDLFTIKKETNTVTVLLNQAGRSSSSWAVLITADLDD